MTHWDTSERFKWCIFACIVLVEMLLIFVQKGHISSLSDFLLIFIWTHVTFVCFRQNTDDFFWSACVFAFPLLKANQFQPFVFVFHLSNSKYSSFTFACQELLYLTLGTTPFKSQYWNKFLREQVKLPVNRRDYDFNMEGDYSLERVIIVGKGCYYWSHRGESTGG